MINYQYVLLECQQAYRKAAVYDAFLELNLKTILNVPRFAEDVAKQLELNSDALSRFLHAAAHLGLVKKTDKKFMAIINGPSYSKDSSIVLFWLFNSKLADALKFRPKSFNELSDYGREMLEAVVKNNLIIQDEHKKYSIPVATRKYLLSDSLDYIGHRIKHFEKIMFPMFSVKGLVGALKTGKSQWSAFFNNEVTHPFALYKDNPVLLEIFTNGLHQLNTDDDKAIVSKLKIDGIKSILDVGGGSGAFVLQILKKCEPIEYVDIYELPDAIPLMKKTFYKYSPKESRVRFVPGSFLEPTKDGNLSGIPSSQQYDLIILGWILHDWTDKTNIEILKRVFYHLKPSKKIVILEAILPENKISDVCFSDMAMLLQTEGRERTFSEYKQLLFTSGFSNISTNKTDTRRQAITATRCIMRSRL